MGSYIEIQHISKYPKWMTVFSKKKKKFLITFYSCLYKYSGEKGEIKQNSTNSSRAISNVDHSLVPEQFIWTVLDN